MQELKKQVDANREIINSRNYFFEPAVSEVKGKLTLNSFYGPPNYGETPDQDAIENVWILNLEKPINVHQEKPELEEGDFNSTQYDIDRIQLATAKHKVDLKKYQDKQITVKGTIWGAHTGHHFTAVLMDVISVRP